MAGPTVEKPASAELVEVRAFFEGRAAGWDKPDKSAKPIREGEIVATAVAVAFNDAASTRQLHPLTRAALDRMWTIQRPDGGWNWFDCDLPPMEDDDYYGIALAATAVGPLDCPHAIEGGAGQRMQLSRRCRVVEGERRDCRGDDLAFSDRLGGFVRLVPTGGACPSKNARTSTSSADAGFSTVGPAIM